MTASANASEKYGSSGILPDRKYFLFDFKMLLGEGMPTWQEDPTFIDAYVPVKDFSLVSPFRLYPLFQFARRANRIDGAFAQVGVYRGGSAKLIASVKDPSKPFYLFDTFEGLPDPDSSIDYYEKGRFGDTSQEHVRTLLSDTPRVEVTKGVFPSCATATHSDTRYAFVYLDVDLYRSNLEALHFFYPRLQVGGMIIVDDYGWANTPGIAKSVHDFIDQTDPTLQPIITSKYQCLLIKDR